MGQKITLLAVKIEIAEIVLEDREVSILSGTAINIERLAEEMTDGIKKMAKDIEVVKNQTKKD